jgi:hypothetical protein
VGKEFGVFFRPDETKLGVNSGSEKNGSDQNTITLNNILSQIAVNGELDKAGLYEHRPPKASKRGQLSADKTRSTREARVNKRQLLRKFIRRTRLINQMRAAKSALVKMEAEIQMELPTFRPSISLDRTRFVVKSLKTLIRKEETRRQSCWGKFVMELESWHDVVWQEIKKLRKGKTRGLPDKDMVQPFGLEKGRGILSFEDICLYCANDRCSGC